MTEDLGLVDLENSPKPLLKRAAENRLFASPLDQWMKYANARTATAHDYSGEKAADTLEIVEDFLDDAIGLYQTMSGKSWE